MLFRILWRIASILPNLCLLSTNPAIARVTIGREFDDFRVGVSPRMHQTWGQKKAALIVSNRAAQDVVAIG
jgi:hypothetical protein